jgi:hypothetical protein
MNWGELKLKNIYKKSELMIFSIRFSFKNYHGIQTQCEPCFHSTILDV